MNIIFDSSSKFPVLDAIQSPISSDKQCQLSVFTRRKKTRETLKVSVGEWRTLLLTCRRTDEPRILKDIFRSAYTGKKKEKRSGVWNIQMSVMHRLWDERHIRVTCVSFFASFHCEDTNKTEARSASLNSRLYNRSFHLNYFDTCFHPLDRSWTV